MSPTSRATWLIPTSRARGLTLCSLALLGRPRSMRAQRAHLGRYEALVLRPSGASRSARGGQRPARAGLRKPPRAGVPTPLGDRALPKASPPLDLPFASAEEGHNPAAGGEAGHLELIGPDHHVEVEVRAVDAVRAAAPRGLHPRLVEAVAERDVRGGVLVDERVRVVPLHPADAGGAVDEGELAQARGARVGGEEGREQLAIGLVGGLEADEAPAAELAGDALDQAAAEGQRPRAAEGTRGGAGGRAREVLLGREVRRDEATVRVRLLAPEPAGVLGEQHVQVRSRPPQLQALQAQRGENLPAAGDRLDVRLPALRSGRVVGAEPAEPEQVLRELPLRLYRIEPGVDLAGPVRRRPRAAGPAGTAGPCRPQ